MPTELSEQVAEVYREVDAMVASFHAASGVSCPPGCGECCRNREIEATAVEMLPLAEKLFRMGEADATAAAIERSKKQREPLCVMYRHGPLAGQGHCHAYEARPLLCRLFGFGGRKNKRGAVEYAPCKVIGEAYPEKVRRSARLISQGASIPLYDVFFMHIAALCPDRGFKHLPINRAIQEALAYLYLKGPTLRPALPGTPQ